MSRTRRALLDRGIEEMRAFCAANAIPAPTVELVSEDRWRFGVCAYYDRGAVIRVCLERCASIGTSGRAWSHPGYAVDRTPYGVVLHELGHHVDVLRAPAGTTPARYHSRFSSDMRARSGEDPISGYCENDAEWFAEMFRVHVANPDLLRLTRPATHAAFLAEGLAPTTTASWEERLEGAPGRTIEAARTRIEKAQAREARRRTSSGTLAPSTGGGTLDLFG